MSHCVHQVPLNDPRRQYVDLAKELAAAKAPPPADVLPRRRLAFAIMRRMLPLAALCQSLRRGRIQRGLQAMRAVRRMARTAYFDPLWYLQHNPDVAAAGVEPLMHYLRRGLAERRQPCAYFDGTWYLQQNPDVAAMGIDPFMHFVLYGDAEGRHPHPKFNSTWYRAQYAARLGGRPPLLHYLKAGRLAGCMPGPADPRRSAPPAPEPRGVSISFPYVREPIVSILIPVHNQWAYTAGCLQSVRENSGPVMYEVILADDGSHDQTLQAGQSIPGLVVVRTQRNAQGETLGFLRNCNHAARKARGKYLLLLNNDTLVQPGWLEAMVATAEADCAVGVVGAKLLFDDGRLQEAGGIIWNDASGWNYGRGDDPLGSPYNYLREVDYVSGAAMLVRHDLWKEIGGFDERFVPAYYEDTDLAFEARRRGYKVLFQPKAAVIHLEGKSHGTDLQQGLKRHQVVNRERFCAKWKDVLSSAHFPSGQDVFLARDRSRRSKHVLFCAWELPDPARDPGSVRATNFLLHLLMSLGYRVSFLPANPQPGQALLDPLQQQGVCVFCRPETDRLEQVLREYGKHFDVVVVCRGNADEECLHLVREYCPQAQLVYDTVDLHVPRDPAATRVVKNLQGT